MLMKCFCYLGLADRPLLLYGHCDDHSQHRSAAFGRRLWYGADSGQRIVCIHVSHHGYSQLDVGEKRRAEGGESGNRDIDCVYTDFSVLAAVYASCR